MPYEGLAKIVDVTKVDANGKKYLSGEARWTGVVSFVEDHLEDPLRWKRPRMIFVNSMSDLFHEDVKDEWITKIFAVMALAPRHTFQVLTKRPERMMGYLMHRDTGKEIIGCAWSMLGAWPKYAHEVIMERPFPLPNVWMGVSVEDQKTADARIPLLLETPAAVRWVSYEPALGPIDFLAIDRYGDTVDALTGEVCAKESGCICEEGAALDWVVCGGESGPGARPMHPDWARSARDQCVAAGVPFHFKQHGEWIEEDLKYIATQSLNRTCVGRCWPDDGGTQLRMIRVGKHKAGRLLDGKEWNQFPCTDSNA